MPNFQGKFGCTLFGELRDHESSDCFEYPQKIPT